MRSFDIGRQTKEHKPQRAARNEVSLQTRQSQKSAIAGTQRSKAPCFVALCRCRILREAAAEDPLRSATGRNVRAARRLYRPPPMPLVRCSPVRSSWRANLGSARRRGLDHHHGSLVPLSQERSAASAHETEPLLLAENAFSRPALELRGKRIERIEFTAAHARATEWNVSVLDQRAADRCAATGKRRAFPEEPQSRRWTNQSRRGTISPVEVNARAISRTSLDGSAPSASSTQSQAIASSSSSGWESAKTSSGSGRMPKPSFTP